MKKVQEIMTSSPVTCKKEDSLQDTANKMAKENIGFIPVIDENNTVIGTITDRDVTLAIAKTSKSLNEIKVSDAMNKNVFTISSEDDATSALKSMRTNQVGRLPVVDNNKKLQGVVSLTGIAGKIKKFTDRKQLETEGNENIMNTLYALAERDTHSGSIA